MRPILTAVIAAIEACAVAIAGVLVVGIPALVLWFVSFEMAADPAAVVGASTSIWFLAHFIPLEFRISPEIALGYGLSPEAIDFTVSLAPLGLTLITVLLAARAGLRFARDGGSGIAGVAGGTAGFAAASVVLVQFAIGVDSTPVWAAALVPASVYGIGSLIAFVARAITDGHPWWTNALRRLRVRVSRIPRIGGRVRFVVLGEIFRLTAASLAMLVLLGALGVVAAVIAGYIEITSVTQGLHLDPLGAIVLFLVQAALIPVACIWAVCWFSGAGFALGAASTVSPFGTVLGPLPSLPLLGAVPQGWGSAAILAPAILVIVALGIGVLAARLTALRRMGWAATITVPVIAAVLTGLAVAGAGALATGSIGPDRLETVGPNPWLAGGLVAAQLVVGLTLGVCAGRVDRARLIGMVPSLGRAADPVADSRYLEVSRTPPPEALFRSAGRRKRRSADVEPSVTDEWAEGTDPAIDDVAADEVSSADTIDLHDALNSHAHASDEHSSDEHSSDEHSSDEYGTDVTDGPDPEDDPEDDTEVGVREDDEELTAELDEEALLEAFAWDSPVDAEPPTPERGNWRWPRRRG